MPFSYDIFNNTISTHLAKLNVESVLDVGAGAGKYGNICRHIPSIKAINAVEPTSKYVEDYSLHQIYTNVYNETIQDFIINNCTSRYDVVIFGDVLEHFFRSQAIDYVDYFLYRSKWVIALWPTFYPQDNAMDNQYEIHKSNFNILDFADKFDIHYFEKKTIEGYNGISSQYNYCIMKGHMTEKNASI